MIVQFEFSAALRSCDDCNATRRGQVTLPATRRKLLVFRGAQGLAGLSSRHFKSEWDWANLVLIMFHRSKSEVPRKSVKEFDLIEFPTLVSWGPTTIGGEKRLLN